MTSDGKIMKVGRSPNDAPGRVDDVRSAFEDNYLLFQYQWVEFFIEHLSDISRAFRGDLQAMIVLAIVGQVQIRAMKVAARAGLDPQSLRPERLSITASRIADVTGIPRETARRKLTALERRGWIVRGEEGAWRLAVDGGVATAKTDLAEVNKRAIARVARLFCELEALVRTHQADSKAPAGAQIGQAPPRAE
jgi:hypothetical protein